MKDYCYNEHEYCQNQTGFPQKPILCLPCTFHSSLNPIHPLHLQQVIQEKISYFQLKGKRGRSNIRKMTRCTWTDKDNMKMTPLQFETRPVNTFKILFLLQTEGTSPNFCMFIFWTHSLDLIPAPATRLDASQTVSTTYCSWVYASEEQVASSLALVFWFLSIIVPVFSMAFFGHCSNLEQLMPHFVFR